MREIFANTPRVQGFVGLLRAFGPADIKFGPRGQRLAAAWVFGSAACIALYFLPWVFPYLLRYEVLS